MSIFQILENFFAKTMFCDHNLKLSSGHQKFKFHFVTINFLKIDSFENWAFYLIPI
jgi:hypothetical protein